jgi:stress-induced morphogen
LINYILNSIGNCV